MAKSMKKILSTLLSRTFMLGEIQMFSTATLPPGWLLCNGAAVSRTSYSKLFNLIGTTYGSGDGSTTFNLPDLRNNIPICSDGVTYNQPNLLANSTADAGGSHTTYNVYDFPFLNPLVEGQTYTITAKVITSSEKTYLGFYHSGGSNYMGYWLPRNTKHFYKVTFTATSTLASQTGSDYGYGYCRVYVSNNPRGVQRSLAVAGTANVEWIRIQQTAQGFNLGESGGWADSGICAHSHAVPAFTSEGMSANSQHRHNLKSIHYCVKNGSHHEKPMGWTTDATETGCTSSATNINHTHTLPAHTTNATGVSTTNTNLPPYTGVNFMIYAGVV